jgi:hypothetical protein
MYRYLGRYIDSSGFDNQHFLIVLIIDGIDTSTSAIVSMSMSQPITSMAPSNATLLQSLYILFALPPAAASKNMFMSTISSQKANRLST